MERRKKHFLNQSFILNVAMVLSEKYAKGSVLGSFHHGILILGPPHHCKPRFQASISIMQGHVPGCTTDWTDQARELSVNCCCGITLRCRLKKCLGSKLSNPWWLAHLGLGEGEGESRVPAGLLRTLDPGTGCLLGTARTLEGWRLRSSLLTGSVDGWEDSGASLLNKN